ncbi:MAG: FAD:protein FMN transferase [Ignavibacteria bacterium]|nr:FAD:protein FMN transferase [Ignavibacteria bacterium]
MRPVCFFILLILIFSCSSRDTIHKRTILSMGTTVEIQIQTNDISLADKAIDSAFSEVQRINDKYTVHKPNSYLNLVNNSDTFQLDDETYFLFQKCEFYNKLSNGAFDPAIGNIIRALGFESTDAEDIPDDIIRRYLSENNWKLIRLTNDKKIIKPKSLRINLGAIAKGYAVDRMFEIVKSFGFNSILVNAGGEVRCSGKEWEIGVQHPRNKEALLGVIKLRDGSIATSGDYERYRINNGKRIHHIFNPITGKVADECQSVTIITKNSIDADALATAVFVLGPIDGMKLIEQINDAEALIVDKNGKLFRSKGINKFFYDIGKN